MHKGIFGDTFMGSFACGVLNISKCIGIRESTFMAC